MSGLEVLGAVASAAQLAAYSIKIARFLGDIYGKAQNHHHQITVHISLINQLIDTAIRIQQNESLRLTFIDSQLQSTLSEARSLSIFLEKLSAGYTGHWVQRSWTIVRGASEREVLTRLERLEKAKMTLALCISLAQTDLLLDIKSTLSKAPTSDINKKIPINDHAKLNPTATKESIFRDLSADQQGRLLLEFVYHGQDLLLTKFMTVIGQEVLQYQDKDGNTALHKAILSSSPDSLKCVQILLNAGIDCSTRNQDDHTPLALSIALGKKEKASYLIQGNADLELENSFGATALIMALDYGHLDIAHELVIKGANVQHEGPNGRTALSTVVEIGKLDMVALLLRQGAKVNVVDSDNGAVLMKAIKFGHPEVVELLLDNGADVDYMSDGGWSPLIAAARKGYADIARSLLRRGAKVDKVTARGDTALMDAIELGHGVVVEMLLDSGADAEFRNKEGETAAEIAFSAGHAEIRKMLQEKMMMTLPDWSEAFERLFIE